MKRFSSLLLAAALAASSSNAIAAGVDLSWNDCVLGSTAAQNQNFACSAVNQTQSYSVMLQFKSPVGVPNFVALTAYLDLIVAPPTPLAPFWHYETSGCNTGGIQVSARIPHGCAVTCFGDPWGGGFEGQGHIAAYVPDYQQPGRGRLVLLGLRPSHSPFPIKAGANYFGLELRFDNRNRVDCVGCGQQAALHFEIARLESNDGSPAVDLSGADKFANCVTINGGPGYCGFYPAAARALDTDPPCQPTPVSRTSWGMLKTLYR